MSDNIQSSTNANENPRTTADLTPEKLRGFVKLFVRGTFFELARTTMVCSPFLRRLIDDPPNEEDGCYHIDRDPEIFKVLINYIVENHIRLNIQCTVVDLYKEANFYGIILPENDCWGTILSYTLKNINVYNIRAQIKSFADQHGIFGSADWRQRVLVDIEFHCHRTFDLNIIREFIRTKVSIQAFSIKSTSENDIRYPISCRFSCSRTKKPDQSSKSPPQTSSSTPSSSDPCPESGKDLIKQLSVEDVKRWVQQTMFHDSAETWFTHNVDGKELLHISQTGSMRNGTLMLSGYDLLRFQEILNRLGWELECS